MSLDQSPVLHSHSSQEEVATSSSSVPRSSSQFSLSTSEGSGDRKKSIVDGETDEVLEDLRAVVEQLPNAFYLTAARVFHHLNRLDDRLFLLFIYLFIYFLVLLRMKRRIR